MIPGALRSVTALALLGLLGACGGGRDFREPKLLTEMRPARRVTSAATTLDDEPFRNAPPRGIGAKARPFSTPTEVQLSNGIRVVLLERHDFPSISAVLVLKRGAAAGAPGVASLYAEALTGSSEEYKHAEAWSYLGFVGAHVTAEAWQDAVTLRVTALSPLFVSALSRGAPMFTSPSLDGDDLDDARADLAAQRARAGDDPSDVARDALHAAVFPAPHPYGTPVSGQRARPSERGATAKSKRGSDLPNDDAARAFRDANLSAENVGVACVGDFDPKVIQTVLEKQLGKLPKRPIAAAPPFPPPAPRGPQSIVVIDRPGAQQSAVAIGWPGPRASDPGLVALGVLGNATAGELSTRLNITVRKELGATYGVHMHVTALREAGIISISAAIDTSRTADAMRGLFTELARLRAEPLSDTELAAAKMREYYDFDRGSSKGLARYLARALAEGLPPAHVVTHNARVDVVTAESVRGAAQRWLSPDEVRVVIVGDASKIVDGLRALGMGEVTVTSAR